MAKYISSDPIPHYKNYFKQLPKIIQHFDNNSGKFQYNKISIKQLKKLTKNQNLYFSVNNPTSSIEINFPDYTISIKYSNYRNYKKVLNFIKKLKIQNSNYHYY